ncbi:putative disease resistance protein At4g19050 [Gastrolobium bilobum]|uniref:putative disease resistance protein At4g19050 n=1 Tax=Gastrolobium bilobum TaxID=150636 RepID=UPI002AAFA7F9|nr:putative disease resistance protein At4g19050 [Gastrolobium bilobum]
MDRLTAWCCKLLTSPQLKAWLKQQLLIPLLEYETRLKKLEVAIQNLKKDKEVLQHKVDEEENRYGRGIPDEVKNWIDGVNKIISEYDRFLGEEELHELAVFDLLASGGYLPKPGIRYRQSRKAHDITKKVNALQQKAKKDTLSYWLRPPSLAAFFSNVGYESFQSRDEIVKKIKAAFEDSNVKMIGLHGFSGVGKTTLVKEVAKEALDEKKFDVVTMANVTRNPDIRKIQGQIAEMLGMTLDEKSEIARATRIQMRLKNEKESVLIIFDDLWAKLDFNMLGIPSGDDDGLTNIEEKKSLEEMKTEGASKKKETEDALSMMKTKEPLSASNVTKTKETLSRYKGCKVLLISEIKQVLSSHMEGKEDSIFCLEVLKDKEAETLFKNKSGIGDTKSEFEKLAAQIAKKCEGLPMHIVTTARALKNQSRSTWEDVNRKLESQKLIGKPEFSTKLSYNLLENEEIKYTFLLCALMGHDALIMDLVKYCIGLGFLQGISRLREAKDRVYALVGKLKQSGLLSDSYSNDHFTMQAIVRSAALSIASEEDKHVFTMTKGEIDEWPDEDKLERYTAICLQQCDIIEGFPNILKCPRLRVFHVNNIDPSLKIPDNFFEGMNELKVLILTGFHLSPLPSSIKCLTKLRMLCLERCMLGEGLSIMGQLKKLRILSLSGSDFEKLPLELNELKKLQIFDISNCFKRQEIPSNVIKSFISLEELYMRNTFVEWNIEGGTNQRENASLSELRHLNWLTTLDIQIPNVDHLPKDLFFDKLYSYKIVIGDLKAYLETDFKMPEKYEASRFLAIQLKSCFDIHSQKGIKMLFNRVEILLLEDLNGVEDIFYRLNMQGFPDLKHLSIISNSEIQSLINPKYRQHPEKVFPKLESLHLYDLNNMGEICSCDLSTPSFEKLKVIKINMCDHLKNVFLLSVVRLLTILETIEVSQCKSLKEIVHASSPSEIEFPKFPELRSLTLKSLSELIGFFSRGETKKILFHEKVEVSKLERMELSSIQIDLIWSVKYSLSSNFQNLLHLDVNCCCNLEYLLSFPMAKNLKNLQSLFVSECEKMQHIFHKGQDFDAKMEGSIFPNLKNIKLSSMKSLSKIWAKVPLYSFGKLDTLIIEECDKLDTVFPRYMEGIFRSLCNLKVTNCESMEAIIDLENKKQDADGTNLQDIHLEALPKLKNIWRWNSDQEGFLNLNNLRKIWVHNCVSLQNIFPISVAKCLYNLEFLLVSNCYELREMVARGEGIKNNTSSHTPTFEFMKLTTVKILNLPKLRSFYSDDCELRFPALNDLTIELCDKLEPFQKTADAQSKSALFPEEVISKLKSMKIDLWHAKSSKSYIGEANNRRYNLEELHLSRFWNIEILYSFLHKNPKLKSLSLSDCSFKEVVPHKNLPETENLGVILELKSLKLIDLPELENIGFERDVVLQRIEFLVLNKCPNLFTIVPSSVSLTYLTNLEVVDCKGLKNLILPLTAKSLGQLKTMKVVKCESLEEIVGKEEENAGEVVIVFRHLETLELVSLKSLGSFCSSNSCIFEFPALEKLIVCACPKMEKFSEKVRNVPILQKIYIVQEKKKVMDVPILQKEKQKVRDVPISKKRYNEEEKEKRCYWKGELNATLQQISREKVRRFE